MQRMAPGVLCREGFLGTDPRPLSEILDTDRSTVAGLEVPRERFGEKLEEVLKAAMASFGAPVSIEGALTAVYREAMGRIPCPWGLCGVFPKGEVELKDSRTGEILLFSPLSVHLVAKHGFFQGRGSRYRMEPEVLRRIFHLGV